MKQTFLITRIRVMATLVIVLYHCVCPFCVWGIMPENIYTGGIRFLMFNVLPDKMLPTFFLISGFLYYAKADSGGGISQLLKKFERLIIPAAVILFIYQQILSAIHINMEYVIGHLWFLRVLFLCFAFSLCLKHINQYVLLSIAWLFHVIWFGFGETHHFSFDVLMFMRYYCWFTTGFLLYRHWNVVRKLHWAWYSIVLVGFMVGVYLYVPFLAILTFNVFLFRFMPMSPIGNQIVKSADRCSFGIYLLHHVFIGCAVSSAFVRTCYTNIPLITTVSMFLFSLLLSAVLTLALKHIGYRYV